MAGDLLESIPCPFTVIIDSQEKAPWSFTGIQARSSIDSKRRLYSPMATEWKRLGIGMGDYSILGFESRIAIERKSLEDFHGTLLGFKDRRDRFKRELENLACMDAAAVVVEASFGQCLAESPAYGVRSAAENRVTLLGTTLKWQQHYRVPWVFCDDRRLAEITAFRILEEFYRKHKGEL